MPEPEPIEPKYVKRGDLLKEPHLGKEAIYHCHKGILGKHKDLDIPVILDNGMQLSVVVGDRIDIEGRPYLVCPDADTSGSYEPMNIGDIEEPLIVDNIPTEELRFKDDAARLELDRIRKESERRKRAWMKEKEDKYGEEAP